MAMAQAALAAQLQNLIPVSDEVAATQALASAWNAYFSAALAAAVPFSRNPGARSAMQAALTGMSQNGQCPIKIQAGIQAFWAAIVASPAVYFPGAVAIAPPPGLATIAAKLAAAFAANTGSSVNLSAACNAIASDLHPLNLGGVATLPGPVASPIV